MHYGWSNLQVSIMQAICKPYLQGLPHEKRLFVIKHLNQY